MLINKHDVYISPIVKFELAYLYEIRRITKSPKVALNYLSKHIGLKVHDVSLEALVNKAETLVWTRDPFDRLIVAHAATENHLLVSKDKNIRKNYSQASW